MLRLTIKTKEALKSSFQVFFTDLLCWKKHFEAFKLKLKQAVLVTVV